MHLFFETALTLVNIWQNLFDPTAVWQGSSTASTARLRRINETVLSSAGTARSSRSGSFDGDQDDTRACLSPMGGVLTFRRSKARDGFAERPACAFVRP
jgi:hypothetical protein